MIKAQSVGVEAHFDPRIFAKSRKIMTLLKRAATNIQRRNKMLSDFLGASGNRTLPFVKINAHFVGVDAHIDPRPEETLLGTPVGERM